MRNCGRILVLAFGIAALPRVARADSPDIGPIIAGMVVGVSVVAITDITFAAYDVVKLSKGERIGTGLAITEIVLAAPQVVIGIYLTSHMWSEVSVSCNMRGCSDTVVPYWSGRLGGIGLTLVPTSIVTMAIVDLARSDRPAARSWMPSLAVAPNGMLASVQGTF
jgi:hypothetical protein